MADVSPDSTYYNMVPNFLNDQDNTAIIRFVAKRLERQSGYARGSQALVTDGSNRVVWDFVCPNEIQESVNHSWEPYESMSSRLADKIGTVHTAIADGTAATSAFKGLTSGSGTSYSADVQNMFGAMANSEVPSFRVDASLVYKNTNRREYSLSLLIAHIDGGLGPYDTIFEPIRELEKLSCPEMTDDMIGINFPNIFQIYTVNTEIININNAAIISIAPTWKGPYIDCFPSVCELTITFRDIEPLYRRSFEDGGIIRVS